MVPRNAVRTVGTGTNASTGSGTGTVAGDGTRGVPGRQLAEPGGPVRPCAALLCAYHYFRGPSGRHMALLLHAGQTLLVLGVLFLALAYTSLSMLANIVVQRVAGIFAVELGLAFVAGSFTTYACAQYTKVGGGASSFWARDILVTLYMRTGGLAVFAGFGISMVGFNLSEDWLLPFRIAGPMALVTGVAMLIGARLGMRAPCFRQRQGRTAPGTTATEWGTTEHCSSCHQAHHLHGISAVHLPHDTTGNPGPIVVYSSGGGDLIPPTATTFLPAPGAGLVALGPPCYESLGARQDSPPGYVLVSPASPPPTYSEACATPKELDVGHDRDPDAPPVYGAVTYDASAYPAVSAGPVTGSGSDGSGVSGTGSGTGTGSNNRDSVVITDLNTGGSS